MQSQSSDLSFRDLVEKVLRQGLNQPQSCFVSGQSDSQEPSAGPCCSEQRLRTEVNLKVIKEFLKP